MALCGPLLMAQPSFGGTPLGLSAPAKLLTAPQLSLKGVDTDALLAEDARNQMNRFAAPLAVDIDVETHGNWTLIGDQQIWQLRISVEAAKGLLVFYEDFDLPAGSQLFVYSPTTGQVLGAYTRESQSRSDHFMTGIIQGNEVVLEYHTPADNFKRPFHIWRIDAVYTSEGTEKDLLNFGFGASDPCHDNVACPTGNAWTLERNAAARIIVVVAEGSGYCTGTLLNNTAEDGRLLLLSAFHCMDGYTPLYDLWRFDFYFASPSCTNPATAPSFRSILGSSLLAGRRAVDFLLLDVYPETAQDMELHFAGWDRRTTPPITAALLHHPLGDIQKISISSTPSAIFTSPIVWNNEVTTPANHHFRVTYSDGLIEVGSSGAALFDQNHRVVAQLHGASAVNTCNQTVGYFGRLAVAWDGTSANQRLKDWLDPLGTDTMGIDALAQMRSALVATDDGEPVAQVTVSFFVNDILIATTQTGTDGRIPVPANLPATGTLRLAFERADSYTNGVTTADLVRMQRHVLTTDTLAPFKILACDVNKSNSLTTLDMIRIRKLILTIDPDFGADGTPSWQFFPADMPITDPVRPWPPASSRNNAFTFTLGPALRLPDFVAVKSGDANGSASTD